MSKKILTLLLVVISTICILFNCQTATEESSGSSGGTGGGTTITAPTTGLINARTPNVNASTISTVAAGVKSPANNATDVCYDTILKLGFDSVPTLGTSGLITIYSSGGTLVDVINLADSISTVTIGTISTYNTTVNTVGYDAGTSNQVRFVKYTPVKIVGTNLVIIPHNRKLTSGTTYYINIDSSVVSGNISGSAFTGIADTTSWTFTTKAQPATAAGTTLTVNADGTGDFCTIQGALDNLTGNYSGSTTTLSTSTINVKNGVYEEMLFARNKYNITIKGESTDGVILQYENYENLNSGTGGGAAYNATGTTVSVTTTTPNYNLWFPATTGASGGRAVILLSGGSGWEFDNITVKNTHVKTSAESSNGGQAECIYFNSNNISFGKLISKYSNWISGQDTLNIKGYSWFYDCFITGDVDFIWGYPYTALFERCELKTRVNPANTSSGGYICQSRAYWGSTYAAPGFIFLQCALTRESAVPDASTYLARANQSSISGTAGASGSFNYDDAVFINCTADTHISSAGYNVSPAPNVNTTTTPALSSVLGFRYYRLYNAAGNAYLDTSSYSSTYTLGLSASQAAALYPDRATIFGGSSVTDGTNTMHSISWTLNP